MKTFAIVTKSLNSVMPKQNFELKV